VAHRAEADYAQWPIAQKPILCKGFEVIFETSLGYESGDQVGLLHEKTSG
jgi:hypothetical protein